MKAQLFVVAAFQAVLVASQTNSTEAPSELPYYGLSPPVYPSRESMSVTIHTLHQVG